jgi:hypothetical protein
MLVWLERLCDFRSLLHRCCGFDDIYSYPAPGQEQRRSKSEASFSYSGFAPKDLDSRNPPLENRQK